MSRAVQVYSIVMILFTIAMIADLARAESRDGSNKAPAVFKSDGKVVSAADANKQAPSHKIEKCTPIKGATQVNGKETLAYKCKTVVQEFNAVTGTPHWAAP